MFIGLREERDNISARTILLEYYVPTVLTEHLLVEICCCGLALLV
jgi:hypothetical protein